MEKTIELIVNGAPRTIVTDPSRPLLEVLREDLDLTGTKYGCGESQCGACTVLLDGKPIRTCVRTIESAAGGKITTIEGISSGNKLHPVQEAFLSRNAFQCGFCTPGMVMELVGLLKQEPKLSGEAILKRMQGHICRCCSYENYATAIRDVTKEVAR